MRSAIKQDPQNWRASITGFHEYLQGLEREKYHLLMVLAGLLLRIVFAYLAILGIIMAFQYLDIINNFFGSRFAGAENLKQLSSDLAFWHARRITIVLSLSKLCFSFACLTALAVLLIKPRSFLGEQSFLWCTARQHGQVDALNSCRVSSICICEEE